MKPCLYALLLLAVCVCALRMPRLNFDLVPYLASVESTRTGDLSTIHARTLRAVGAIQGKHRTELYSTPYSRDLLSSPEHLAANIPFYNQKIMYVVLVRCLQRVTGAGVLSTVLPSVIGYLGIGVLVWFAVGQRSALLAAVLMCQPILLSASRYSTPDLFGALWIVAGALLFLAGRKVPASVALLISVWVRPDAIVYVVFILAAMFLHHQVELREFCVLMVLALASCWSLMRFGYSWAVLFHHSFVDKLPDPSAFHPRVTLAMYIHQASSAVLSLSAGYLCIYLLFAIIAWRSSGARMLILPLATGAAAHFLLYPSEEERLYLPFYLVASIVAVRGMTASKNGMEK